MYDFHSRSQAYGDNPINVYKEDSRGNEEKNR